MHQSGEILHKTNCTLVIISPSVRKCVTNHVKKVNTERVITRFMALLFLMTREHLLHKYGDVVFFKYTR